MLLKVLKRIILDFLSTPAYQLFKTELEKLESLGEQKVLDQQDRYKGLSLIALYTSFEDLINIFKHPEVKGVWVDIGGGSGRSCLLYSFVKNESSINLEIDPARALIAEQLAQKFMLKVESRVCDLQSDVIPSGDTYFLYFPTGFVLDRVLDILSQRVDFTLVVIESHGDLIARIDKEKGYELIDKILLTSPRHNPFAHIYRKTKCILSEAGPHQLSFKDELLVIEDSLGEWVADSFGLEWLGEDTYQFLHPPRAITWSRDFKRILSPGSKDFELIKNISLLRKLREVRIVLDDGKELNSVIRKIRISGTLRLEISTSELLEWRRILKIFKGSHLCYESSSCSFSLPVL